MDDMISRQAAIDRATKEHDFFRGAVTVSDKARRDELLNVMCWLGELPPASNSEFPNNSDTISRAKAIEAIDEIESEIAEGFGFEYEKWRKYFCDLPPAQPERIRGRWIEHDDGLVACECSVCHEKYNLYEEDVFGRNFCPNCGADMRGEQDE